MKSSYTCILGNIINPINSKKCEYIKSGALLLKNGKIIKKGKSNTILSDLPVGCEVIDFDDCAIVPGFYDMHFHWVQDDVRLMPKDSLLEWLSKYTWPYEKKFSDKKYSKNRAQSFAKELVKEGTVGGAVYSSIHGHTVDDALKFFVGNYIVGNVLMTMNSPSYLSQTKRNALSLVKKLTQKYKNKYALTPRFAPTTHPSVMKEASKMAKKSRSFIQTHLSETQNEIDYVLSLYRNIEGIKNVKNYTDIYKKVGLLGPRTIMGHGIYLSDDELEVIQKTKTAIAHCPTSNAPIREKGLGSGLFNFKKVSKMNIPWALGSDIGGGPFLSMFDVMRSFVDQNKKANVKGVSYKEALYRATLAGAEILGKGKSSGSLEEKKDATFLVLDVAPPNKGNSVEYYLEKIISRGLKTRSKYSEKIVARYIDGKAH